MPRSTKQNDPAWLADFWRMATKFERVAIYLTPRGPMARLSPSFDDADVLVGWYDATVQLPDLLDDLASARLELARPQRRVQSNW